MLKKYCLFLCLIFTINSALIANINNLDGTLSILKQEYWQFSVLHGAYAAESDWVMKIYDLGWKREESDPKVRKIKNELIEPQKAPALIRAVDQAFHRPPNTIGPSTFTPTENIKQRPRQDIAVAVANIFGVTFSEKYKALSEKAKIVKDFLASLKDVTVRESLPKQLKDLAISPITNLSECHELENSLKRITTKVMADMSFDETLKNFIKSARYFSEAKNYESFMTSLSSEANQISISPLDLTWALLENPEETIMVLLALVWYCCKSDKQALKSYYEALNAAAQQQAADSAREEVMKPANEEALAVTAKAAETIKAAIDAAKDATKTASKAEKQAAIKDVTEAYQARSEEAKKAAKAITDEAKLQADKASQLAASQTSIFFKDTQPDWGVWVNSMFDPAKIDFKKVATQMSDDTATPEKTIQTLNNPNFYKMFIYLNLLPGRYPRISPYKTATLWCNDVNQKITFQDCMDSTIMNFICMLAYDPVNKIINLDSIISRIKNSNVNPKLVAFLTNQHPALKVGKILVAVSPFSLEEIPVHDAWTDVVANIPGVCYFEHTWKARTERNDTTNHRFFEIKPEDGIYFEMKGLQDSFIIALDYLLGLNLFEGKNLSEELESDFVKKYLPQLEERLGITFEYNSTDIIRIYFEKDKSKNFDFYVNAGHGELQPHNIEYNTAKELIPAIFNSLPGSNMFLPSLKLIEFVHRASIGKLPKDKSFDFFTILSALPEYLWHITQTMRQEENIYLEPNIFRLIWSLSIHDAKEKGNYYTLNDLILILISKLNSSFSEMHTLAIKVAAKALKFATERRYEMQGTSDFEREIANLLAKLIQVDEKHIQTVVQCIEKYRFSKNNTILPILMALINKGQGLDLIIDKIWSITFSRKGQWLTMEQSTLLKEIYSANFLQKCNLTPVSLTELLLKNEKFNTFYQDNITDEVDKTKALNIAKQLLECLTPIPALMSKIEETAKALLANENVKDAAIKLLETITQLTPITAQTTQTIHPETVVKKTIEDETAETQAKTAAPDVQPAVKLDVQPEETTNVEPKPEITLPTNKIVVELEDKDFPGQLTSYLTQNDDSDKKIYQLLESGVPIKSLIQKCRFGDKSQNMLKLKLLGIYLNYKSGQRLYPVLERAKMALIKFKNLGTSGWNKFINWFRPKKSD